MIEYMLITAIASLINIYAVTAATEPNLDTLSTKAPIIIVEDVTGRDFE